MKNRIKQRPTLSVGEVFISEYTNLHSLYSADGIESYLLESKSGGHNIGVLCKNIDNSITLLHEKNHREWWNLLGSKRVKIVADDWIDRAEVHCFIAVLEMSSRILFPEDIQGISFAQDLAESLLAGLMTYCLLARSKGLWPIIESGGVCFVESPKYLSGIPILVNGNGLDLHEIERATIRSMAKLVYSLSTGIDLDEITVSQPGRKVSLPPAIRWNKDIEASFSSLLAACLNGGNGTSIESFSDLAARLGNHNNDKSVGGDSVLSVLARPNEKQSREARGFAKVGGMVELKQLLTEEVVRPIREPDVFRRYGLSIPNGILLFGPPGCGKTYIARALAEEIGFYFIELTPAEIASPFIHDTVLRIRDIFTTAEEKAPTVIFIDEFEALVPARSELSGGQQYKSEEVNEFLINLNNCAKNRVFIIAATNEPTKIDNAVLRPGRIDKVIYVGTPDLEARVELLRLYLANRPIGTLDLGYIAESLAGYSASDIQNIVDEAARVALKSAKSILQEHFAEAIKRNPSSLPEEVLTYYSSFKQRGM